MLTRIAEKIYHDVWCITPSAHRSIQSIFERHVDGHTVEPVVSDEAPERVQVLNNIAIINAFGICGKYLSKLELVCGGLSVDQLISDCREAVLNDNIDAVLINFNSPGGIATGIYEAGQIIRDLQYEKPIYGFCETQCCSAAYWLASQCSAFFATNTAHIGSIGVYVAIMDNSEQLEREGIKLDLIKAGKYKAMGLKSLTDEERAIVQKGVDKTYSLFKSSILSARPDIDDEYMQGLVYDGSDAADYGLVDYTVLDLYECLKLITTGEM